MQPITPHIPYDPTDPFEIFVRELGMQHLKPKDGKVAPPEAKKVIERCLDKLNSIV